MNKTLPYVTPEEVGVSVKAVESLLEELDGGGTEPHGLLMVRDGKVFAEGYWKPYAKGLVHGMQSLTKTYAGTAIGIAMEQGIVGLDERIVDIFPKEAEGAYGEYLEELTVRHVLSMSTGMRKISSFEGNWIENFLNNPIIDKPGTKFFYNSVGSTLLGEIIRRKTGKTLDEYLKKNLYCDIGMDADKLKWLCLKDGMEIGGSGLYTTLDNNTKLGLLYLAHGKWNGKQIINREFCELASAKQIDNAREDGVAADGHAGYGFQMWMGLHKDTYCMSGAWGQYTIMCPNENMVISFSGRTNDAKQAASDSLLGKFWRFLENGLSQGNSGGVGKSKNLKRKLAELSLPAEDCQPYGERKKYEGIWKVTEGEFDLDMTTGGIMQVCYDVYPIDTFQISFEEDELVLEFHNCLGTQTIHAGMDGIPRLSKIKTPPFPSDKIQASAAFDGEKLVLHLRWIETCYSAKLILEAKADGLAMSKIFEDIDPVGENIFHEAKAKLM